MKLIEMHERESNIELMRCVLMFMIVGLHVIGLGILWVDTPVVYGQSNYFQSNFLESFFVMSVNCFVLISGYFGIRATFSKFLKFYFPIWFYSVSLYLILSIYLGFNWKSLFFYMLPFLSGKYWFVKIYILLFLISPLLNKILADITKRQLKKIIVFGLFIFVLIPSISPFSLTNDRGFGIVNFIMLYFIGFYIKNFHNSSINKYFYLWGYILSSLLIFSSNLLSAKYLSYNHGWMSRFYAYDFILVYCSAILFFLFFKSYGYKSKTVNKVSPLVFLVYIIHEHPSVREVLYKILHCEQYYKSEFWVLHTLQCMILIFITSIILEFVRRSVFSKLEDFIISGLNKKYLKMKLYFQNESE